MDCFVIKKLFIIFALTKPLKSNIMENQVPAAPQKNGLALAGLIVGIIGFVLAWIPIINFFAWILGPLAIVFGIIGAIGDKPKKGQAIAAIILGALCIVVYYVSYALYLGAAADAVVTYGGGW